MAKVKSINNSSNFYRNNSSFPDLKIGLDVSESCSSKYDFDISLLLSDNETVLEKHCADNDNWSGKKNDNKEGRSSPQIPLTAESPRFKSLGALAENHLKLNKMLPELKFNGDFDLTDLLSNCDCSVVDDSKKFISTETDNLYDLCFLTEDDNPTAERNSAAGNGVSFDDLSDWMNSSVTQTSDHVKNFHNHLSPEDPDKFEEVSRVSFKKKANGTDSGSQRFKCCDDDVQRKSDIISNIDLVNLLNEVSFDSSSPTDSSDTLDSLEKNDEKYDSSNKLLDTESDYLPDVDLTFCIKKNTKNNLSQYGNSPETVDSGFDESDFTPNELSISPKRVSFNKNVLSQSDTCNKNIKHDKVKQSLISKAISSKPKIDNTRKLKLKHVMNNLLTGTVPLMHDVQKINSQKSWKKAVDQSNESIIISSYMKFTEATQS